MAARGVRLLVGLFFGLCFQLFQERREAAFLAIIGGMIAACWALMAALVLPVTLFSNATVLNSSG